MNKKQKKMLTRIIITTVMVIALNLIPTTGILKLALYLAAYLVIGYDILKKPEEVFGTDVFLMRIS